MYEFEGTIREVREPVRSQEAPKENSNVGLAVAGSAVCLLTGNLIGAVGCAYGAYILSQEKK